MQAKEGQLPRIFPYFRRGRLHQLCLPSPSPSKRENKKSKSKTMTCSQLPNQCKHESNFPSHQSRVYKTQVPYNYAFQNSLTAPSPAL